MIWLVFTQVSCSSTSSEPPQIFLETVYVEVNPRANLDTAVAMDLIIVYDEALVDSLFKMSALSYFEQKKQIIRDSPGQMDIWSWEVVPGQEVTPMSINMSQSTSYGAVVFANYLTPGDHRVRIGTEWTVKIVLGAKDFSVIPNPST